ncbi:hypothetical protein J9253_15010 [Thiothrix litoralis]|jgi:hypothetical protein|uniref:Uncharacterized protein n=1 Tax=Thiothrix litoralis TaxID=2891210 RepID=A0ABX7WPA9_9GAMM|nr:hypothetical protein [Thiothrix litoralis]QTR45305.1 hypothetical protein J9253_15010 [Thiothrix litoralis]
MTRKPKRVVKPPRATTLPKRAVKPPKQLTKPLPAKAKPRQQRKPKAVKVDELALLDRVLDYLGNYILIVLVSAAVVGLAYLFTLIP